MDEFDAARAITDHMLEKGHRRIGFLRGPREHLVSIRRYNGYAAALGGKGLRIDPGLIVQGDFSRESGRAQAAGLFAAKPTAIFASDGAGVGAADRAAARRLTAVLRRRAGRARGLDHAPRRQGRCKQQGSVRRQAPQR